MSPSSASSSPAIRRFLTFVIAAFSCVLTLALSATRAEGQTANSLALRTLVVYNVNNSDSTSVANYYIVKRSIPVQNLCAIAPPATDTLTWSQYVSSVKTPVQNCLNAVGAARILYIVFTYQTPYDVIGSTSPLFYALDQYVSDIWDQYRLRISSLIPGSPSYSLTMPTVKARAMSISRFCPSLPGEALSVGS